MHFLDFWLIYALLSQNVVAAIYTLFPLFRMYDSLIFKKDFTSLIGFILSKHLQGLRQNMHMRLPLTKKKCKKNVSKKWTKKRVQKISIKLFSQKYVQNKEEEKVSKVSKMVSIKEITFFWNHYCDLKLALLARDSIHLHQYHWWRCIESLKVLFCQKANCQNRPRLFLPISYSELDKPQQR